MPDGSTQTATVLIDGIEIRLGWVGLELRDWLIGFGFGWRSHFHYVFIGTCYFLAVSNGAFGGTTQIVCWRKMRNSIQSIGLLISHDLINWLDHVGSYYPHMYHQYNTKTMQGLVLERKDDARSSDVRRLSHHKIRPTSQSSSQSNDILIVFSISHSSLFSVTLIHFFFPPQIRSCTSWYLHGIVLTSSCSQRIEPLSEWE